MAEWIEPGTKAADFTLPTHDGSKLKLSSLRSGSPWCSILYPKDDTPGCTKEACAFRDAKAKYAKHKAVVLGVSPDEPASHGGLARNTNCRSRSSPMSITRWPRSMGRGGKRTCMARNRWASPGVRS